MLATPTQNSAIFQELEKGDVIAMKGYVTNGQPIAGDTVWYVTAPSYNASRRPFEDKDLHDLSDFDTNLHLDQNQKNQEEFTARLFWHLKSSGWRYCKSFT